ncbi:hypothetical protein AB0M95_20840 [Sphaerisporangium sp. NPDC051017]
MIVPVAFVEGVAVAVVNVIDVVLVGYGNVTACRAMLVIVM